MGGLGEECRGSESTWGRGMFYKENVKDGVGGDIRLATMPHSESDSPRIDPRSEMSLSNFLLTLMTPLSPATLLPQNSQMQEIFFLAQRTRALEPYELISPASS